MYLRRTNSFTCSYGLYVVDKYLINIEELVVIPFLLAGRGRHWVRRVDSYGRRQPLYPRRDPYICQEFFTRGGLPNLEVSKVKFCVKKEKLLQEVPTVRGVVKIKVQERVVLY